MANNVRKVSVKVTTRDGKDEGAVPTYIEVDRGAGHVRVSGRDIVANKDGEVNFELKPGERLVIEGYTEEAIAFDREQAAAYNPATQKNSEGKIDAPSSAPAKESSKAPTPLPPQASKTAPLATPAASTQEAKK